MKILFISRWYPFPPDNGSKIRIFNLLKYLSACHEVDLISFVSETVTNEQMVAMNGYFNRVNTIPYRSFQPGRLKALAGFFSPKPRSVIDTYNANLQRCVEQASQERRYDVVIASQIDMAPYALVVPDAIKVFEEVELTTLYEGFARQTHPLKKLRYGLTWWKLAHYTADLLNAFDACTVVSKGEAERVRQVAPDFQPVEVVPNGVDVGHYEGNFDSPEIDTLIYSGALTYKANFDAVDFFLHEIFPLIQTERPQVKLFITGKIDGVPIHRLPANKGVIFTGYLDDIRPRLTQSWVSVVPLREGGGTRLKILEALAAGTPVVATSKGAEGLDLTPEKEILIANDPADFAAVVLRLLQNPGLRETLSCNGRSAVAARYDWQMIGQQFNEFVERVVVNGNVKAGS